MAFAEVFPRWRAVAGSSKRKAGYSRVARAVPPQVVGGSEEDSLGMTARAGPPMVRPGYPVDPSIFAPVPGPMPQPLPEATRG